MTAIRFYVNGDRAGPLFRRLTARYGQRVRDAARSTAQDAAAIIESRGKSDIAGAGNFGSRWTDGLHADVTEGGGNIRIGIHHDVPYWTVFENGKQINGKPLLWIPLSFADDAQGVRASDYPGALFRVDRKSGAAPLLLDIETKQPVYFGKESVTIPKKFHLTEIVRETARALKAIYKNYFKQG